jgi:hypothetical protein
MIMCTVQGSSATQHASQAMSVYIPPFSGHQIRSSSLLFRAETGLKCYHQKEVKSCDVWSSSSNTPEAPLLHPSSPSSLLAARRTEAAMSDAARCPRQLFSLVLVHRSNQHQHPPANSVDRRGPSGAPVETKVFGLSRWPVPNPWAEALLSASWARLSRTGWGWMASDLASGSGNLGPEAIHGVEADTYRPHEAQPASCRGL